MADDDTEDDEGEEEGEKKSGKMKLIIIAVAALVVLGGGGGAAAYFMGYLGGAEMMETAEGKMEPAPPPPKKVYYYSVPEITVNLSSAETRAHYLRMNISLEFSDKDMVSQVEPNLPRVMDAFQTYLRELRVDDLSGSAGLFRLKEELQRRINVAIYPARVDDILFKDIKVQ